MPLSVFPHREVTRYTLAGTSSGVRRMSPVRWRFCMISVMCPVSSLRICSKFLNNVIRPASRVFTMSSRGISPGSQAAIDGVCTGEGPGVTASSAAEEVGPPVFPMKSSPPVSSEHPISCLHPASCQHPAENGSSTIWCTPESPPSRWTMSILTRRTMGGTQCLKASLPTNWSLRCFNTWYPVFPRPITREGVTIRSEIMSSTVP